MELASLGLPDRGEPGMEMFEKQSLLTTDFQQRMNYLRALQGELERSISSLEPIADARVHLALPEPSVFIAEEQPPTASVILTLRPGQQLNLPQTRGIAYLVARAVEGMSPENVTIADSSGREIFTDYQQGAGTEEEFKEQFRRQRLIARDIENNVQTMLDQAVGPGNSTVRAHVELDFEQHEMESETFAPAAETTGVPTSKTKTTEKYSGSLATPTSGPAGTASNVNVIPPTAPGGAERSGEYTKEEEAAEYRVSSMKEKRIKPSGRIERLAVAVLLNATAVSPTVSGTLRQIVATAAGIDLTRGDTVEIQRADFYVQPPPPTVPPTFWQQLLKYGSIGLAALALLLVTGYVRRRRRFRPPDEDIASLLAAGEIETGVPVAGPPGISFDALLEEEEAPEILDAETARQFDFDMSSPGQKMIEAFQKAVDENIPEAAQILRIWVAEEQVQSRGVEPEALEIGLDLGGGGREAARPAPARGEATEGLGSAFFEAPTETGDVFESLD
jgi:flagellar M-ring protein FliF